jgi:Domain of unknown function (DUF4263)
MTDESEYEFFKLRRAAKTYISKVFSFNSRNPERVRQVRMVLEGSDQLHLGEIEGALCLRLTGNSRKTQVSALVTQDEKLVKRVTLQTFKSRSGDWIESVQKDEFTFRADEFERLLAFLRQIEFVDMSNDQNFQIEDISSHAGPKAIIDASDRNLVERIRNLGSAQRDAVLRALRPSLTDDEVNTLLGRKQGLAEFEKEIGGERSEIEWQDFFEREEWVFGYGLDYRIMRQFSREAVVGAGGIDNQNKPMTDFLMTYTEYTVLVEIKRPGTPIFRPAKRGRAGTWEFTSDFISAVSQILEQKAEWTSFAEAGEHYDKATGRSLTARTRNARCILVIGSRAEFDGSANERDANLKRDTFELFRRECRGIDIVTFDELLERARFIAKSGKR